MTVLADDDRPPIKLPPELEAEPQAALTGQMLKKALAQSSSRAEAPWLTVACRMLYWHMARAGEIERAAVVG
ncbi:MAG: hypothetical protein R3E70_15515 [Burkholderiaceae bacterium]